MLLFQVNSREISEKGKGNLLLFKSSVFTMLYSDPKEALQLYNAVNGTEYKDPELLEINTLEYPICIRL